MTFEHTWTAGNAAGRRFKSVPALSWEGSFGRSACGASLANRACQSHSTPLLRSCISLKRENLAVPSADGLLGWHAFVTASTCSAFSVRFPLLPLLTVLRRRTLRTWFELFILNDEALPFANVAKLLVGLLGWRRGRRRRCRTRKRAEIAGEVDQKPARIVNGVAEVGTNGFNVVFEGNSS